MDLHCESIDPLIQEEQMQEIETEDEENTMKDEESAQLLDHVIVMQANDDHGFTKVLLQEFPIPFLIVNPIQNKIHFRHPLDPDLPIWT